MSLKQHRPLLSTFLLVWSSACHDQNPVAVSCPSVARFGISPESVNVIVGQTANIAVVELNCGRPQTIYPLMAVTDTMVAWAINTHRFVKGRTPGTTTLILTSDDGFMFEVGRVRVVVR